MTFLKLMYKVKPLQPEIRMLKRFTDPYMLFIKCPILNYMPFILSCFPGPVSVKLLIDKFGKGRSWRKNAFHMLLNLILVAVLNGRTEGHIFSSFEISDLNIITGFLMYSVVF